MRKNRINRIGLRFGRLTVIAPAPTTDTNQPRWLCRCDCGNEKSIQSGNLVSGGVQSCGCFRRDQKKATATHGHTRRFAGSKANSTPSYRSWIAMNQRCNNENHTNYPRYGGRGITVCERWSNSFENFLEDLGPRPSLAHSLERENRDGNYEPGNVIWATSDVQTSNRSTNRMVELNGTRMTVTEAAKLAGVPRSRIFKRLNAGWTIEQALRFPSGANPGTA